MIRGLTGEAHRVLASRKDKELMVFADKATRGSVIPSTPKLFKTIDVNT